MHDPPLIFIQCNVMANWHGDFVKAFKLWYSSLTIKANIQKLKKRKKKCLHHKNRDLEISFDTIKHWWTIFWHLLIFLSDCFMLFHWFILTSCKFSFPRERKQIHWGPTVNYTQVYSTTVANVHLCCFVCVCLWVFLNKLHKDWGNFGCFDPSTSE